MLTASADVDVKHPVRRAIIEWFIRTGETASPKDLLGLTTSKGEVIDSLPLLSYHFRALRDGGVIKLVKSVQIRGAYKHLYRLVPEALTHTAEGFVRDGVKTLVEAGYTHEQIHALVTAAMEETKVPEAPVKRLPKRRAPRKAA